jgi:exonuclease V gamma subunit
MQDGLAKPLPFRPAAAWAWLEAGDVAEADEAASKAWANRRGGEGTDAATVLALRGAMPFVDASATIAFRAWARDVFAAVRDARVPEPAA